jgi:hypothetical protein
VLTTETGDDQADKLQRGVGHDKITNRAFSA